MNKSEFMQKLKRELSLRKVNDIAEILSDYEEHFRQGHADCKTDEEIISELGLVEIIANEYAKNDRPVQVGAAGVNENYRKPVTNKKINTTGLVLLICFDVCFGIAIAAIIFSLGVAFISIAISCIAAGGAYAIASFTIFGAVAIKFAGFFIGIAILILGVLAAMLIKPLIKSIILLVKQYVKFHTKIIGGNYEQAI